MSADDTQDLSLGGAERLLLGTRPHPKVLVAPALAVVLLVPTASFVVGRVPEGDAQAVLRLIVAGLASVLLSLLAGVPLVRWATTSYEVTGRRLVVREGLRRRPVRQVELAYVRHVLAVPGGLVDRLLRCGTLVVDAADGRGGGRRLLLHDVPDVAEVRRTLVEAAPPSR